MKNIPYTSPQEACTDIRDRFYGPDSGKYLRVLPYNRHDPTDLSMGSWWWLSPTAEKSGHKYGKFVFCPEDEDNIFIGFAVEKGFGTGFAALPEFARVVIDKSWRWHVISRAITDGSFEASLEAIQKRSGANPSIVIGYDEYKYPEGSGYYAGEWINREKIQCIENEKCDRLASSPDLKAVWTALQKKIEHECIYIDFRVGMNFGTGTKPESESWTPETIRQNLLRPLEQWIENAER